MPCLFFNAKDFIGEKLTFVKFYAFGTKMKLTQQWCKILSYNLEIHIAHKLILIKISSIPKLFFLFIYFIHTITPQDP